MNNWIAVLVVVPIWSCSRSPFTMVNKPAYKFLMLVLQYFLWELKRQSKGGLTDCYLCLRSFRVQVHCMYIAINSSYSPAFLNWIILWGSSLGKKGGAWTNWIDSCGPRIVVCKSWIAIWYFYLMSLLFDSCCLHVQSFHILRFWEEHNTLRSIIKW